uniref:DUF3592 domain-containing protein n=1 Tax=viral metagenome TaxID=1070528 RepID=A0A6C0ACA8_9ZZZZ
MNNAVNAVGDVSGVYFQWRFYLSVFVAIIMVLSSVYLIFFKKDNKTVHVTGVVDDQYCVSGRSGTNCNIRVIYKFQNKEYKTNVTSSSISLKGDNIELYIDPSQPDNPTVTTPGTIKMMGYGLSVMAILMVGVSYLIYRATKADKGFANFMLLSSFLSR